MTFPHDHLREVKRVEEHSIITVAGVSVAMIAIALVGVSLFLA